MAVVPEKLKQLKPDKLKEQIQTRLPPSLSRPSSNVAAGFVMLIVAASLLLIQNRLPKLFENIPPDVNEILISSIVIISSGLLAFILDLKRKYTLPQNGDVPEPKNIEKYFNYYHKDITISYTFLNNNEAIYESETTFVATGSIEYPGRIIFAPIIPTAQIRLLERTGYKSPQRLSKQDLRKWSNSFVLETEFKGPVQKGTEHIAWAKIKTRAKPLPPHLYIIATYPIKGEVTLNLDLSKLKQTVSHAKLLTFISEKATRPIIPVAQAPVKKFGLNKKLSWTITNPKFGYQYILSWREPCGCSWCKQTDF